MDLKLLFTTFATIFLAELGDKTQLATLAFSAEASLVCRFHRLAGALVLTSLLGVVFGLPSQSSSTNYIKIGAGVLFVILGLWSCYSRRKVEDQT